MILRPLITEEPDPSRAGNGPQPAWSAVERSQLPRMDECWLIPQPAHAALSGEIAAQLSPEHFPGITPEVVQAIALHDAGWGLPDAEAIQKSRASTPKNPNQPKSFIKFPPQESLAIWTFSIDTTAKLSPVGGYIVSRHFAAIGKIQAGQYDSKHSAFFARFEEQEMRRQEKLLQKARATAAEMEPLVKALQFCDLLSLYISCGTLEDASFPQTIGGQEMVLRRKGPGQSTIAPFPLKQEAVFSVSGLRHPRPPKIHASAQSFSLRVAQAIG
jgi:hypothetical protein